MEVRVSNPRWSVLMQYQIAGADNCIKACKEIKSAQPLHQGRTRKHSKRPYAIKALHSTVLQSSAPVDGKLRAGGGDAQ